MAGNYDVAQICLNGHVISTMAASNPQISKPFCVKCGSRTIMDCPACNTPIRGYYHVTGVIGGFDYDVPSYCHQCGKPYPWTEEQIKAAIRMFAEVSSDEAERASFAEGVQEISRDTPQAAVEGYRLGKMLKKITGPAAGVLRDILVNLASDEVGKRFFSSG